MMNIDPRHILVAAAREFYQAGWMLGTAGNLSLRNPDGSFWITASGKNKGELTLKDFICMDLEGNILESPHEDNRPSAETSIHQTIYTLFPETQTCYHVHSVEANLVSNFTQENYLPLPPLEMLKGLGIWEETPEVYMPLFKNYLQVPNIAQEISIRFLQKPPQIPALLIRHHGVTVWGQSAKTTQNYLEIVEYIFRYMVSAAKIGL